MTSPLALVFFALFAIIQVWIYLAIRRGQMAPGFVLGAGLAGSVIAILLMSIAQQNEALHAVLNGIVIGTIFSLASYGMATYFRNRELGSVRAEN